MWASDLKINLSESKIHLSHTTERVIKYSLHSLVRSLDGHLPFTEKIFEKIGEGGLHFILWGLDPHHL